MKLLVSAFAVVLLFGCGNNYEPTPTGSSDSPQENSGTTTYFRVLNHCGDDLLYCDQGNANAVCANRFGYDKAVDYGCVREWCGRGNTGAGYIYSVTCWKP